MATDSIALISRPHWVADGPDRIDSAQQCFPSADGGTGVRLFGTASPPRLLWQDSIATGGIGGSAPDHFCAGGANGRNLRLGGGRVRRIASQSRFLSTNSPVRETETITLSIQGRLGEHVFLIKGTPTQPTFSPGIQGALHLAPNGPERFLGVMTSGHLALDFPAEELGPGVESSVSHFQVIYASPGSNRVFVSNPVTLVHLDRSF